MDFNLNQDELNKLLDSFKKPKEKKITLEKISKLIEILAIVISAVWCLYLFLNFDKTKIELENTAKTLEIQQSREEAKLKGLELKSYATKEKLDNRAIELSIERNKQDSILKKIDLESYKAKSSVELELERNELQLKKMQFENEKSLKFNILDSLRIVKVRDIDSCMAEYKCYLTLKAQNNTDNAFQISYVLIDGFIIDGNFRDDLDGKPISFPHYPPNPLFFHYGNDDVPFPMPLELTKKKKEKEKFLPERHSQYDGQWATMFHRCSIYDKYKDYLLKNDPYLKYYSEEAKNIRYYYGTLTGDYKPGENDVADIQFNISVNKFSFLGFSLSFGLNRSDPKKDLSDDKRNNDDDLRNRAIIYDLRELK